jgi:sterol desaturase/sphingolipid hydroxylase (fatty acid hydroxylase superfamily)
MNTFTLFDLAGAWAGIWLVDTLRYLIAAALGAMLVATVRWPMHRVLSPRPWSREQVRFELRHSLTTALIFSIAGVGIYAMFKLGWTRIYSNFNDRGLWYWIGSLAAVIVLHDAYFYWSHRLLHLPALMRRVHWVHHRSYAPTPWAAYSFHPVEALINALFLPLCTLVVPLHGSAMLAFMTFMIARNVLGHGGHEVFPRFATTRRWLDWSTTVSHHHLHHQAGRGNYSLYFTWWDRWCGTESPSYLSRLALATGARLPTAEPKGAKP